MRRAACDEVNMWLSAARVFVAIDVVVVQHYLCRVLVIPDAMAFVFGGQVIPVAEFGGETRRTVACASRDVTVGETSFRR